jgi:hypothetical protein
VGPLVEQFIGDSGGDSEASGGVFRVHDHQVDAPPLDQGGEVFAYNSPSGLAEDVTDKENAQKLLLPVGFMTNDPATGTKWLWLPVLGICNLGSD